MADSKRRKLLCKTFGLPNENVSEKETALQEGTALSGVRHRGGPLQIRSCVRGYPAPIKKLLNCWAAESCFEGRPLP